MSRSWLQKAISIHDLGNHFYVPNASKPWDCVRDREAEKKLRETCLRPSPVANEFRTYFDGRMHDSGVLGIESSKARFALRLNSRESGDFSHYVAAALGVPPVKDFWPAALVFHEPVYVHSWRYDARGALRFANFEAEASAMNGECRAEYLRCWFYEQDGRIQCIHEIWSRGNGALSPSIYLAVDAKTASVVDQTRARLAQAYGEAAARVWDEATNGGSNWPYGSGFDQDWREPIRLALEMRDEGL